jgi:arylsulfatase A-like enzyme
LRRPSRIICGFLVGTVIGPIAGCRKDHEAVEPPARPNVLLIVVDTLRADKLGCYGSDLGATPCVDALAAEGVRFERSYSHAPWTTPAVASILTSLYPPEHQAGGRLGAFTRLPESVRTLAECFRDAGYATAAVINVDFLTRTFGMTQGFEHTDFETYPSNVTVRPAGRTTDAALTWLRQPRDQPFFLMVHYFDPHLVYAPPAEYRRRFAAPEDRENTSWVFGTREQVVGYRRGVVRFDEATIRRAEKLYDGEVAYTDHEVGRLVNALDGLGLAASTIVVFTADHGEEFLDHGQFEHGHTLYNELVHVPLIFRYPERLRPGTVTTVIGHVDVGPTLCELAGLNPDPSFVGRSLVGLMDGDPERDRPIVLEGNFWGPPLRGWIHDGYKLILAPDGQVELYHLDPDPGERDNLRQREPERLRRMVEDFKIVHKSMAVHNLGDAADVQLTPEEAERLRSAGYLR